MPRRNEPQEQPQRYRTGRWKEDPDRCYYCHKAFRKRDEILTIVRGKTTHKVHRICHDTALPAIRL